jgi:cell division protein FtsQ
VTLTLRRFRFPRVSPLLLAGLVVAALALGGGWMWLRSSSLVGVNRVTIVGAAGPDAAKISAALQAAARNMTTLNVQLAKLRTAVAPYPVVKDLKVTTAFPHGIRIHVIEQVGVATLTASGGRVTVTGNGTVLRDVAPSASLPTISVPVLPGGTQLTDASAMREVAVLAAAPYQLLDHVQAVTGSSAHGVIVHLRNGPSLYFGDTNLLVAKWIAAAGVLADPNSKGASYIDVTDPQRPAAGVNGVVAPGNSVAGSGTGASVASGTGASVASGTAASVASATPTSPSTGGASAPGTGGPITLSGGG